jgi:hypothetical protein
MHGYIFVDIGHICIGLTCSVAIPRITGGESRKLPPSVHIYFHVAYACIKSLCMYVIIFISELIVVDFPCAVS